MFGREETSDDHRTLGAALRAPSVAGVGGGRRCLPGGRAVAAWSRRRCCMVGVVPCRGRLPCVVVLVAVLVLLLETGGASGSCGAGRSRRHQTRRRPTPCDAQCLFSAGDRARPGGDGLATSPVENEVGPVLLLSVGRRARRRWCPVPPDESGLLVMSLSPNCRWVARGPVLEATWSAAGRPSRQRGTEARLRGGLDAGRRPGVLVAGLPLSVLVATFNQGAARSSRLRPSALMDSDQPRASAVAGGVVPPIVAGLARRRDPARVRSTLGCVPRDWKALGTGWSAMMALAGVERGRQWSMVDEL